MVTAVQDLRGDPRVVGEPLRRQGRQACASGVQEAFARKRVQYVGVAEAGGVAHRNDRPTNVKVVAVRVRQGVNRYRPVWFGWVGESPAPAPAPGAAQVS